MVEGRYGSLPGWNEMVLLNKLFQMRPAEIARLEGLRTKPIRQAICMSQRAVTLAGTT